MTPQDVSDLLKSQRAARHVEALKHIRGTVERRIYLEAVPGDVREAVKAAYLEWHKEKQGEKA